MVAAAECMPLHVNENQCVMLFKIGVLPKYRKQGIGHQLLARVTTCAGQGRCRFLQTTTFSSVSAGEILMRHLGALPGAETRLNKLDLAVVDRNLLQQWQWLDSTVAEEFELGFWSGPFPEDDLPAMVDLMNALNEQHADDFSNPDAAYSPKLVREADQLAFAGNMGRWVLYVRSRTTKRVVGFTAVHFHPSHFHEVGQGDTVVLPAYQRRGLGRWLKAAMLERLLQERPETRYIFTSNGGNNEAVLKINHALGFKPYLSQRQWKVDLETVQAYLHARKLWQFERGDQKQFRPASFTHTHKGDCNTETPSG